MRGAGARAGFSFSEPEGVSRTGVGHGGAGKKATGRKAGGCGNVGRELGSAESKPRQGGVWRHGRGGRRELLLPAAAVAPPLAIARPYSFGGLRRVAARYWSPPARCALPWAPRPLAVPLPPGLRSGLSCRWDCEMTRRAPRKNLLASSHFRAWGPWGSVAQARTSGSSARLPPVWEMEQRLKLRFFVSQPDDLIHPGKPATTSYSFSIYMC
jgi:hypothetical protein